ncbi:hypothetical protein LZ318_12490 [Saccharopolyspora indica]|uniref:hypothetical protein n=1 Tax=Saccharopolyspora indica TaxID=1229659 RepID=UPI0022EADD06|nr:hypothetical protein [Saccharopolyspora indica]MDA3643671.1 hypothetical protein [Saccharopolyspora indica]
MVQLHTVVRAFSPVMALGAVLLLPACGQDAGAPSSDNPGQQPSIATSAPSPGTDVEPAAETTAAESPDAYVVSFAQGGGGTLVQRPGELVLSSMGKDDVRLTNLTWSSWAEDGAVATGTYVHSYTPLGEGEPDTKTDSVDGVQLTLSRARPHNGKLQYGYFELVTHRYEPIEGPLTVK